jgi:hypothetical protein
VANVDVEDHSNVGYYSNQYSSEESTSPLKVATLHIPNTNLQAIIIPSTGIPHNIMTPRFTGHAEN